MPHLVEERFEQEGQAPKSSNLFTPSHNVVQSPTRPDFINDGKVMAAVVVAPASSATSKSVRIDVNLNETGQKTIWVSSNQAVTFEVQVLLDESELSGGLPVWRNMTDPATPLAVAATYPAHFSFSDLFKQVRIKVNNAGGSPATVNAWVFSVA
jgi:hypothetical protein